MSEAIVHILFPGIDLISFVRKILYINTFQKFVGTLNIENQDSYSSTRENELSSSINEKVPIEASGNEIRTDNLVPTSSGFNDSEIPS